MHVLELRAGGVVGLLRDVAAVALGVEVVHLAEPTVGIAALLGEELRHDPPLAAAVALQPRAQQLVALVVAPLALARARAAAAAAPAAAPAAALVALVALVVVDVGAAVLEGARAVARARRALLALHRRARDVECELDVAARLQGEGWWRR